MASETESKLPTISDDLVVTKYKMAADIVNRKEANCFFTNPDDIFQIPKTNKRLKFGFVSGVLKHIMEGCVIGASVRDLCVLADKMVEDETGKAFKKDKKMSKGKTQFLFIILAKTFAL